MGIRCARGWWKEMGHTLGSSFFAFPWSLDIFFVYLTMYLIDTFFRVRFLPIPEMVECP